MERIFRNAGQSALLSQTGSLMGYYIEKAAIITLKVHVKSEFADSFTDWQAQLNREIAAHPGFVSLEFLSATTPNSHWVVVQRFSRMSLAMIWKNSKSYLDLLQELKELAVKEGVEEVVADESAITNGVTEVIIAEVNPEKTSDYRDWISKIHLLEAKSPGFRGVYVQSPHENKGKFWITLLQFDTMENLDKWLDSSERQHLLQESKSLISYIETHRVISPYAGWFASIAKKGELPSLWKQTMTILLVLFPIVMLEFKYLSPWLKGLNISASTFIGNAISVSLISFPMMPLALYLLGWWLTPRHRFYRIATVGGTFFVFLLYLLEIWAFWSYV